MVKENETIEALHERAKIIVDMELLWPDGMWWLGQHEFGTYLHILSKKDAGGYNDPQPWEGITGRVKQETNRMLKEVKRNNEMLEKELSNKLEAETGHLNDKLDEKVDQLHHDMCELTALVRTLVEKS